MLRYCSISAKLISFFVDAVDQKRLISKLNSIGCWGSLPRALDASSIIFLMYSLCRRRRRSGLSSTSLHIRLRHRCRVCKAINSNFICRANKRKANRAVKVSSVNINRETKDESNRLSAIDIPLHYSSLRRLARHKYRKKSLYSKAINIGFYCFAFYDCCILV